MKKIIAIILVVALSALCLTGCGFFEDGEMDEGSIISSGSKSTKTATVNAKTAEVNVGEVLLGDISQEEVDEINGRISWLIGYTNDLIEDLQDSTKVNADDIAKNKAEYEAYKKVLEEELESIDKQLNRNEKGIEVLFKKLNFQNLKIVKNIKKIWKAITKTNERVDTLEADLETEKTTREAADTANAASITEIQGQIAGYVSGVSTEDLEKAIGDLKTKLEGEIEGLGVDDIDGLRAAINALEARIKALEDLHPAETEPESESGT